MPCPTSVVAESSAVPGAGSSGTKSQPVPMKPVPMKPVPAVGMAAAIAAVALRATDHLLSIRVHREHERGDDADAP